MQWGEAWLACETVGRGVASCSAARPGPRWPRVGSILENIVRGFPPLTGFPGLPGGIARLLLVLVLVRVPCLLMFHVSGS